jgi:hypothetical protein
MTDALRALLERIDELDTLVFEAQIAESLSIELRRCLAQMGHLVADALANTKGTSE